MDQNCVKPVQSEAHPDSMDFLSRAWCDFAVQALQPSVADKSIVLVENAMKQLDHHGADNSPLSNIDRRVPLDDGDFMSMPWQSNDIQSWISMQQALHPEVNYKKYFGKNKVTSWKIVPPKLNSVRKWLKDLKLKRKEDDRLQRSELHAAISVAGVAVALAAIAAENTMKCKEPISGKDAAIASAAALVARQCTKVAESMGAKKEELRVVVGSALTGAGASEILTLTAAAATSLRGAETLKERARYRNRLAGSEPVLPIDENTSDNEFDFKKWRAILAGGTELHVETPDGNFRVRSVSIKMTRDAKIILQLRKSGLLKKKQESVITQMHAELYKADQETENTCYLIVLTTRQGLFKLDMGEDQFLYEAWATAIDHLFTLHILTRSPPARWELIDSTLSKN